MCQGVTKGTLRRRNKIEFCIACFKGYSAGCFNTKIKCLTQFLRVIANSVMQNMHYEI